MISRDGDPQAGREGSTVGPCDHYRMRERPPLLVEALAAGIPEGPVLDLASGASESALAIAEMVRDVTTVDLSDAALHDFRLPTRAFAPRAVHGLLGISVRFRGRLRRGHCGLWAASWPARACTAIRRPSSRTGSTSSGRRNGSSRGSDVC